MNSLIKKIWNVFILILRGLAWIAIALWLCCGAPIEDVEFYRVPILSLIVLVSTEDLKVKNKK